MWYLALLGRVSLTDGDGRSRDRVLRQPKRLALLVYLLLAGNAVRRDTLLAVFWPELDDRRARRALSQALYYLGRALGADVIVGARSETIAIAPSSLACDVRDFEAAVAAAEDAPAIELYQGELLAGFFLGGCPDWQEWLDRERTRLSEMATAAATALSRRAQASGDRAAAAHWARRAVASARFDERPLRDLMRLLAQIGEAGAALHEYQQYVQWLREALDDEPEAETRALADDVRSARVSEEVRSEAAESAGVLPSEPSTGALRAEMPATPAAPAASVAGDVEGHGRAHGRAPSHGRTRTAPRVRRRLVAVMGPVLAAVLVVEGVAHLRRRSPPAAGEADRVRIAVVPFGELGAPSEAVGRWAAALTAAVADQLAEVPSFEVVPVADARQPGDRAHGPERGVHAQGPALLLEGAVLGRGREVRFRYTLVDARSGTIQRSDTLDRPLRDSLSLVEDAARAIAAAVRVEIGRETRQSRWAAEPRFGAAGRLVAQADWERRRARALKRAGSADAARSALERSDSLLVRAAQQAPGWAEPWIEGARTAERLGSLDLLSPTPNLSREEGAWRRGIAFAAAAIAVDPAEARAWEMRGVLRYLLWGTLAAEARPDDRILDSVRVDLERAITLDHLLPRAWSILSAALATEGRLPEAAEAAQEALAADRYLENTEEILLRLYETSLDLGRESAAWHWCAEVGRRDPASIVAASCTLGLLAWSNSSPPGAPADPWRILRTVHEPPPVLQQLEPELEMQVAAVLARRGERDSALAVIRRAGRKAGPHPPPPLLRLEALALATVGDRAGADSAAHEFARYDPAAARHLGQSRAFERLETLRSAADAGARPPSPPRARRER